MSKQRQPCFATGSVYATQPAEWQSCSEMPVSAHKLSCVDPCMPTSHTRTHSILQPQYMRTLIQEDMCSSRVVCTHLQAQPLLDIAQELGTRGAHRRGCIISGKSHCGWLPAGGSMLAGGPRQHAHLGTGQGCQPGWILICVWLPQLIHLHTPTCSQPSM